VSHVRFGGSRKKGSEDFDGVIDDTDVHRIIERAMRAG
jgi:hypothetical protein